MWELPHVEQLPPHTQLRGRPEALVSCWCDVDFWGCGLEDEMSTYM